MSQTAPQRGEKGEKLEPEQLAQMLRARFEATDQLRRGICLLNAGHYDQAETAFRAAADAGCADRSLPSYLAACLLGRGKPEAAAEQFAQVMRNDDTQTAACIRHALALWAAGDLGTAMQSLRDGIRCNPESAELHFQLGTLLTSVEDYDEAELRFTQALSIDRDHTEALVSLALCRGIHNAPGEALAHLQRAQSRRPRDARIGSLVAQAARAAQDQGHSVRIRADMPDQDTSHDEDGIEALSRVIEAEPEFLDAFLTIPTDHLDEQIFITLLETLEVILRRRPEHAELHYQYGRLLDRLGRRQDAIRENERAIQIEPKFVRALIELAKLYQATDRSADATTRLEQAIAAGAGYADVYYLLGNLYRDQGKVGRARSAYRRALILNDRYEAAMQALETLPVG